MRSWLLLALAGPRLRHGLGFVTACLAVIAALVAVPAGAVEAPSYEKPMATVLVPSYASPCRNSVATAKAPHQFGDGVRSTGSTQ